MKRWILSLLMFATTFTALKAQEPNLDTVKARLYAVNKVFDSSRYLAFDVLFNYHTDTLFGKFERDMQMAKYVINDRHFYMSMGEDEYIQTDSFLFTIYHEDRLLVMSAEPAAPLSQQFALREFLDSILYYYDSAYAIKVVENDSVHAISFAAKADTLPYSRFTIEYQANSFLPLRIEAEIMQYPDFDDIPDTLAAKFPLTKVRHRAEMVFENYSVPLDPNVFLMSKYVSYDRFRKIYKPAPQLQGYRLMTSGISGNDFDPYAEIPPPGAEPEPEPDPQPLP